MKAIKIDIKKLVTMAELGLGVERPLNKEKRYWICADSAEYNNIALNIAFGNGITNSEGEPSFYRVPGYSLFLALSYKLFGTEHKMAMWLQIFLSSFIPILVFYLSLIFFPVPFALPSIRFARQITQDERFRVPFALRSERSECLEGFHERAKSIPANLLLAKISAIFSVFNISFVLYSGVLMSEALFLLFFLLFCIFFFSSFNLFFCREKKIKFCKSKLILAGTFLGIASLIRPVGHFIIFVSILLLLFSSFNFLKKLKSSFLFFIGWFCIVFGWLLRNYLLVGAIFFHAMPGFHFLNYFASEVHSIANKCSYAQSKDKLIKEWQDLVVTQEKEMGRKLNDLQRGNLAQNVAAKYIKTYPIVALKHGIVNIFKTIFSLNASFLLYLDSGNLPSYNSSTTIWDKIKRFLWPQEKFKFLNLVTYFEMFFLFLILFGSFGSLFLSLFDKNLLCQVFKVLPIVCLLIAMTFGSGVARLRMPIEPFLIIFSFFFWQKLVVGNAE